MNRIALLKYELHSGVPKICVPILESGMPAIINEIKQVTALPIDMVEWRMDCFFDNPVNALPAIAQEVGVYPLLCTLRSKNEGGQAEGSCEQRAEILESIILSGKCQLIDIELSLGEDIVKYLISCAQRNNVLTVISKHNYRETPSRGELVRTFQGMHELGGDLCKYAVMPHSSWDVLSLLEASLTVKEMGIYTVAIAMDEIGKISRIAGSYFGSCITFAQGKNSSAPGQIPAEDLKEILNDIKPKQI